MSEAATPTAGRTRLGASLGLLIFAIIVAVSAFAQVGLVRDGSLPTGMFGYGLAITVLAGVAFFVMRRFTPYADPVLLPLAMLLNGLGLAMIYRIDQTTLLTFAEDKARFEATNPGKKFVPFGAGANVFGQLLWTVLSIALFITALIVLKEIKVLQRYHYSLGLAGLVLLIAPIFFPGINGSKIWITIGSFSVQPSEFCKFAFIAFFAAYLVKKRSALSLVSRKIGPLELPRSRDLMPILAFWVIALMIMAVENDFGTALLFFGLFVSMVYIATGKVSWVVIGLGMFLGGAFLLYLTASTIGGPMEHINQRVEIWLNPEPFFGNGCSKGGEIFNAVNDPDGYKQCLADGGKFSNSEQLMKGLFALAQGGVLGTGLGQGQPYLNDLAFSDEIFTSFGEEIGLTGLMAILLVYVLLVERGFKIAIATKDEFSKLFAGGISFVFALQVFAICGGVTKLVPFTGLTTPFLTQGGSSLLANWILIAILLRLSHEARKPAPVAIQDEGMTQIVNLRGANQ
ncbi:FtsW/RodA/SpoVE family cell cycle protein [Actinocorallia sp. API 0066]|uniref:FtsW/RodA/SpoVE family cell cycle protein n=1 Tax=Actinocorallia sp. API 0066 TaxID=2896846 RepID=UPI001E5B32CD|nr:FtsW/RodA/SpoVE family cell cycle protein [Actinocorallia sp. API 0066]MCD0452476.1 FtsW/RodA/SpoVE family cell cycle protein [Actinocorallia sp. API 0066]